MTIIALAVMMGDILTGVASAANRQISQFTNSKHHSSCGDKFHATYKSRAERMCVRPDNVDLSCLMAFYLRSSNHSEHYDNVINHFPLVMTNCPIPVT